MLMLNKQRAGQLDTYIKSVSEGMPSLEAGQRAFGNLGKLDSDLRLHLRARSFPSIVVPASKVSGGSATVRVLNACEARIMPIRIHSAVGVNEKSAPGVALSARKAAAGCENDAFVQRTLAETEYDAKNNSQSAAAADRALAADPTNIMAMVYKGRVYARAGDWANARQWLVRANKLDPNYAMPLVLYHDSFTAANQKPSAAAQTGLLRALVLVPQDASVRLRVIRAMIAEGNLDAAHAALSPLALSPHAKPDAPAVKILKMIDEKKDRQSIMAEMDKAKWNEVGKF
jgi:cytochrome c-type biogenesis protein CcmH/NrfG